LDDFLPKDEADLVKTVPAWASNPIDQVLNSESKRLSDAIHTLPRKYRIVSVLRDVEGFSTAETAQILGITPSNVKVRLHRARLYLRENLKSYYEQNNP
jgi:RNA polymerase sigma-70 factor (ECF subfamily)